MLSKDEGLRLFREGKWAMAEAALVAFPILAEFDAALESYRSPVYFLNGSRENTNRYILGKDISEIDEDVADVLMTSWMATGSRDNVSNHEIASVANVETILNAIEDHASFLDATFPNDPELQYAVTLLRAAADGFGELHQAIK